VRSRDGCPPQQAAAGCHLPDRVTTCQQCRHLITPGIPQMTPPRKRILPILWIARKPRCALSWTTIFASMTVMTVVGHKPVLLALFVNTRYLQHHGETERICAADPTASAIGPRSALRIYDTTLCVFANARPSGRKQVR